MTRMVRRGEKRREYKGDRNIPTFGYYKLTSLG